ncbi:hypothetical protein DYB26_013396, partial [Aphanomyces astaci]
MPPPNRVGVLGSPKVQDLLASTIQPGRYAPGDRDVVHVGVGGFHGRRRSRVLATLQHIAICRARNNAYITGLHETIMIVNAVQQFVVPIKSIPAQESSVWTSIVASVGMVNLLFYASMFTVSPLPAILTNVLSPTPKAADGMGVISKRLHDFTDMLPHPIAECIGSVNASDLLAAVMPSLKDPVCATAYVSLLTWKGEVSSALVSVAGKVLTDKVFEAICAPFVDVIPCLESVLLQTVMPL